MTAGGAKNKLARFGEERAADWYRQHGFEVLEQNWFCPPIYGRGELDLILRRDALVVVSEVKTRSSKRYGSGYEAVGRSKQQQIRKLATIWLHEVARRDRSFGYVELRFDVADVDARGHLVVYEQAF